MARHKSPFRISAVIIRDGKLLFICRKRNEKEYFILVGGTPEANETHEQTLVRETKEEANLNVKPVKKLGEVYNDFDERTHFLYLAQIISGELRLGGSELDRQTEKNQYILEWHSIDKIADMRIYPEAVKEIIKKL